MTPQQLRAAEALAWEARLQAEVAVVEARHAEPYDAAENARAMKRCARAMQAWMRAWDAAAPHQAQGAER